MLEVTLKALTRRNEERFISFYVKPILKRVNTTQQKCPNILFKILYKSFRCYGFSIANSITSFTLFM